MVWTGPPITGSLAGDDPEQLRGQRGHARGQDTNLQLHFRTMRHIATYAGLIPMAFFGVLIRLGFEALGDCKSTDTLTYMLTQPLCRRWQGGLPNTLGAGSGVCYHGNIAVSQKRDQRFVSSTFDARSTVDRFQQIPTALYRVDYRSVSMMKDVH